MGLGFDKDALEAARSLGPMVAMSIFVIGIYAGYFRDLDGNRLSVFCMG